MINLKATVQPFFRCYLSTYSSDVRGHLWFLFVSFATVSPSRNPTGSTVKPFPTCAFPSTPLSECLWVITVAPSVLLTRSGSHSVAIAMPGSIQWSPTESSLPPRKPKRGNDRGQGLHISSKSNSQNHLAFPKQTTLRKAPLALQG